MSFLDTIGSLAGKLFGGKEENQQPNYESTIKGPDLNSDESYSQALKYNRVGARDALNQNLEVTDKSLPLLQASYASKKKIDAQADTLAGYNKALDGTNRNKYWN